MTQTYALPKQLPAFFWYFIRKQKWGFALLLALFCMRAIDNTLFPYITGLVIDAISSFQGDRTNVWPAVAIPLTLGALLWVSLEVCYRTAGFLNARITPKLEADVRMSMFEYVQRHSYSYFASNFSGSIANRIAEMPTSMTYMLYMAMTLFIPVLLTFIISVTLFAYLSPLFGIIIAFWMILHVGICLAYAKRCADYANIHAESRSSLAGKIVDSLTNHLNVRLFARYRFERDYLQPAQIDEQHKHRFALSYVEKVRIALGVSAFLGPGVAITWLTLYQWQQRVITTGDVVFIFNATWNVIMMAWTAGLEIPSFFRESGVCQQALSIIRDLHDVTDVPDAKPLKVTHGEIVFENVTFHYTPEKNVFENKNLVIRAGSKVGLVGFSGSGKTTFVHLILRYFDVEEGRILIDGQDISQVTQDSLRSQIGMIPQDTSLFHRTLRENILYGRPDANQAEFMAAVKQASCHDFIEALPEKYQTLCGERGVKISGGQRQRIAIARAILKNAPILILDEATSALDSMTEKNIQEALEHLMEGRTTIVIAHRLSTLSGMDRILVFKDGKVVEDGSHEDLLASDSHYASMWNMQAGGFLLEDTME